VAISESLSALRSQEPEIYDEGETQDMFIAPEPVYLEDLEPEEPEEEIHIRTTEGIDGLGPLTDSSGGIFSLRDVDDDDLLLELASRNASHLTDEQAVTDLLLFAERYKKSVMKTIPLFMTAAQQLKTHMLGK
jgi:hypothetical protein